MIVLATGHGKRHQGFDFRVRGGDGKRKFQPNFADSHYRKCLELGNQER